jgi:hypothetical protein
VTEGKAEWKLAQAMENTDPFGAVVYSTGVTLDLTASEEDLANVFVALLRREGRLLQRGITCELKDEGQDCLHCPVATLDSTYPRSVLCRLGKDESTVEKAYEAKRANRHETVSDLAALADEMSEIGDMPDDLIELLTQVTP